MKRLPLVLALALTACATSSAFRNGERAERRQDFDKAVLEYSKALQEHPDKLDYRKALQRAKLRDSEEHTVAGRRLLGRGLFKEALDEFKLAYDLNPTSSTLPREIESAEAQRRANAPAPTIDQIKDRAEHVLGQVPPEESTHRSDGDAKCCRQQDEHGQRQAHPGSPGDILDIEQSSEALGKTAGVNFVFDPEFHDQPITIDLTDVGFEQALNTLGSVGKTFYRVLDPKVVMVVPDTPNKRREYEQQVVKTFFLSNADLKETIDLLRIVLGARRVAPLPGANALTINDTPDKVAAAERIVDIVDKERAEVMVEVEILEVNRTKLKEYGIELTSAPGGNGIQGAVFPATTITETVRDAATRRHARRTCSTWKRRRSTRPRRRPATSSRRRRGPRSRRPPATPTERSPRP